MLNKEISKKEISYRADIDGIRSIAILPVVLFHYGVALFGGGFVGVDVFFVLSGYLITGLLAHDISQERFSYAQFYDRRIRRILPSFGLVVFCVLVFSLFLLPPREMIAFGKEIGASSYFSTNLFYFRKDGYFDGASDLRLLLNTWSLSVEEQFYIFMPILMAWGYRRYPHRVPTLLLVLCGVSFIVAAVSVWLFPSAAFYLLPSRAWELLCGSLLVYRASGPGQASRWVREVVAGLGLAAILFAVFCFNDSMLFPGPAAALPCLGTVALIWSSSATDRTWVARILSARLPVAIGRISYAWYLWHWPLLVLARHWLLRNPTQFEGAVLMILSAVLAALSTHFIEKPFRSRRVFLQQRKLFFSAAALLLMLFGANGAIKVLKGLPQRFDSAGVVYASYSGNSDPRAEGCSNKTPSQVLAGDVCAYGTPRAGAPDFVLWGDSHAGALMPVVDKLSKQYHLWGLHLSFPSCPPIVGVEVKRADQQNLQCVEKNEAALALIHRLGIKTVIWADRWALYSESWAKFGIDASHRPVRLADKDGVGDSHLLLQRGLENTLDRLLADGGQAYVMEPVPEAQVDVPNALAINRLLHRSTDVLAPRRADVEIRQSFVQQLFRNEAARQRLNILPTLARLCSGDPCRIEHDGIPLYRDNDHLSVPGALFLEPVLSPLFDHMSRSS